MAGVSCSMGGDLRMKALTRAHPLWFAYLLHRLSGIALAVFLPVHFWVLSLALTDPKQLDNFLQLTQNSVVKFAEFGLVFLLAVHLFGGLRLMAMEWLPWTPKQKTYAACATAVSFLIACLFFMRAI